jgi:hypothetical protein
MIRLDSIILISFLLLLSIVSSGYGRCIYGSSEWYEGYWKEYQRHGLGHYQWPDGRCYEGEWQNDHKHGRGVYSWPDGDRYEGQYQIDQMNGFGRYVFADSTVYEGNWKNDQSDGFGTFLYADGAKFEGHFSADQKHGLGIMSLPNAERYVEWWERGIKTEWRKMKKPIGQYESVIEAEKIKEFLRKNDKSAYQTLISMEFSGKDNVSPMPTPPILAPNRRNFRLAAQDDLNRLLANSKGKK